MEDSKRSFNDYEKIFLWISSGLFGLSILLFFLMFIFIDSLRDVASQVANIIVILLLSSLVSFFTAIFRILRYAFVISHKDSEANITKSVISLVLSPTALIIYYIIIIVIAFSSCSLA